MPVPFLPTLAKPLVFTGGLFLLNLLFLALGLYDKFTFLDDGVHFFGGLSIAYFIHQALKIFLKTDTQKPVFIIFGTVLIALLWELMEFGSDRIFGTKLQFGIGDTITDLVIGSVGALVLVVIALMQKYNRERERTKL